MGIHLTLFCQLKPLNPISLIRLICEIRVNLNNYNFFKPYFQLLQNNLTILSILTKFIFHPMTKILHLQMRKTGNYFTHLQQNRAYYDISATDNNPSFGRTISPIQQ